MHPRILITGGSGFLGRHLAVRLREANDVVLAARNDSSNLAAQATTGCTCIAMDVARIESVRDAFREAQPKLVIHAAATKHVGACERQPLDCIDVNVGGSQNVARVALEHGVAGVVGISSDKATPPTRTTYGATKLLMEHLWSTLDAAQSATLFASLRLGNLAWSTGSVLCEWERMAREDGVIQTTGRDMRRFFLTGDEAARIVEVALLRLDSIAGRVLIPELPATRIGDLLDVFAEQRGVETVDAPSRAGDCADESMASAAELASAEVLEEGDQRFLMVRPGGSTDTVREPATDAPRMTAAQLEAMARRPDVR